MTHLKELHKKWMKDPEYRAEYEALHLEFEIMNALIRARLRSGLTQTQIGERMGTTQSAVARLEGGRSNPSVRTLERYAKATGTRIRIWFEPVEADAPDQGERYSQVVTENGANAVDIDADAVGKSTKEPVEMPT